MKTIIVTGCYGYIGSKLVKELLNRGYHVIGIDLMDKKTIVSNEFEFFTFDDAFYSNVDYEFNPYIIFHMAWAGVSTNQKNDPTLQFSNINLTYKVLEFSKKYKAYKVVIPGTATEFSRSKSIITGDEIDSPSDLYSATKVATRKIATQFCLKNDLGLNWVFITSAYSIDRTDSNLIFYTISQLAQNKCVECTKLEQNWDYIYVDDLIQGLLIVGFNGGKFENYPLGSGITKPLSYYVSLIGKMFGKENLIKIGAIPYKNKYIDNCTADISKLKAIGFNPAFRFEDTIIKIIDSYRHHF